MEAGTKNWLSALAGSEAAVLVTVAAAQGSCPRETGAKMLVTAQHQFDTIGGGHLELRACDIAREMLGQAASELTAQRRLERFPLGPGLGQCCGGVVHLAFERIAADQLAYRACLQQRWQQRQDSWRLVALDEAIPAAVFAENGIPLTVAPAHAPSFDTEAECRVLRDVNGHRWLVDPCRAYPAHLYLFGAGHVGAALVQALAPLPCHITWIDERDDMFPAALPANTRCEATDTPETIVSQAPPCSHFLVMTHSHALDLRLSEAILRRGDAGWFGLIGSRTKRMQFEHRLREHGISDEGLTRMVCPIGTPGIEGKMPAVIAAAVTTQLLQVWEAQQLLGARSGKLQLAVR